MTFTNNTGHKLTAVERKCVELALDLLRDGISIDWQGAVDMALESAYAAKGEYLPLNENAIDYLVWQNWCRYQISRIKGVEV